MGTKVIRKWIPFVARKVAQLYSNDYFTT